MIEKQKVYYLKKEVSQKQFETIQFLFLLQAMSFFKEKLLIHFYYCEKTMFFCFWPKAYYSHFSCHSNEI